MDVNKFDWQSDTWKVIKKMFNCPKFLVCHQIDSYNHFLDKSIGNIVEQFNPINLNYDYIDEQVYYKLSDECITKLSKVELIKYKDLLNWVEYKDCKESFEENLFNTINSIYINKNEEIKSLDLAKQLSNNTENDKINKIDIFIKNNLVIKKIPVNKHRYELEINISNPILAPAVINENNGVKKLMYPSEAQRKRYTKLSRNYAFSRIRNPKLSRNYASAAQDLHTEVRRISTRSETRNYLETVHLVHRICTQKYTGSAHISATASNQNKTRWGWRRSAEAGGTTTLLL